LGPPGIKSFAEKTREDRHKKELTKAHPAERGVPVAKKEMATGLKWWIALKKKKSGEKWKKKIQMKTEYTQ